MYRTNPGKFEFYNKGMEGSLAQKGRRKSENLQIIKKINQVPGPANYHRNQKLCYLLMTKGSW